MEKVSLAIELTMAVRNTYMVLIGLMTFMILFMFLMMSMMMLLVLMMMVIIRVIIVFVIVDKNGNWLFVVVQIFVAGIKRFTVIIVVVVVDVI